MASLRVISAVSLILCYLPASFGWFEYCNEARTIGAGQSITIQTPSNGYLSGSSCRYNLTTASGYGINLQCNIEIDTYNGQCYADYFFVSTDSDPNLDAANFYCGTGSVQSTSLFNRMTIAYTSYYGYNTNGYFTCTATSYKQNCDCGWSKSSKIVGGTEAGVNEFISMVGLIDLPTADLYCGGAIIHYRYILTAAHCCNAQMNVNNIGALVGDHDTSIASDTDYSQLYTISQMFIHENYNKTIDTNDIGILKTTKDIQYSRAVGPVCLPFFFTNYDFTNVFLDVAGWGSTDFARPKSDILLKTQLKVTSQATCSPHYPYLTPNQFCTYTPGKDSCQSDSGGSLYYRNSRLYSIGLVSHGYFCGTTMPSVNTKVVSYLTWITQKCSDVTFCQL